MKEVEVVGDYDEHLSHLSKPNESEEFMTHMLDQTKKVNFLKSHTRRFGCVTFWMATVFFFYAIIQYHAVIGVSDQIEIIKNSKKEIGDHPKVGGSLVGDFAKAMT